MLWLTKRSEFLAAELLSAFIMGMSSVNLQGGWRTRASAFLEPQNFFGDFSQKRLAGVRYLWNSF